MQTCVFYLTEHHMNFFSSVFICDDFALSAIFHKLPVLPSGVPDKSGSKFPGIFRLLCHQVPEDPPGSETTQSSVQI